MLGKMTEIFVATNYFLLIVKSSLLIFGSAQAGLFLVLEFDAPPSTPSHLAKWPRDLASSMATYLDVTLPLS